MNIALGRRIDRLEQEVGRRETGMVVHWHFNEDTQHLHCAEQNFTRQEGESLTAFTDRAAGQATAAAPGKILWMEAIA